MKHELCNFKRKLLFRTLEHKKSSKVYIKRRDESSSNTWKFNMSQDLDIESDNEISFQLCLPLGGGGIIALLPVAEKHMGSY